MEELLNKALDGDNNAYGDLLNIIFPDLYYIAKSRLRSNEDVEEVVQETAFKSFKNLKSLKDKRHFKTWIIRILLNECKNVYIKKSKQLGLISKIVYFIDPNNFDKSIEDCENDIEFRNMLSILNNDEKIVAILHYKYGYTTEDIAYMLQKNLHTVRSHIFRAREKVKKYVKEGKYDESRK